MDGVTELKILMTENYTIVNFGNSFLSTQNFIK